MCVHNPLQKGIHLYFPTQLVALRQAQQMTPEQLAEKSAIDLLKIQRFESGYAKPAFDDVRRIADALEVGVEALLGLTR